MRMAKMAGVGVVCVALCAAAFAVRGDTVTNMESWAAVPYAVTQTAAVKRVDSVVFVMRPTDGRMSVMERYTLFDARTNVLRTGTAEYSQAALADKLLANGETLARLKSIIKALAVP